MIVLYLPAKSTQFFVPATLAADLFSLVEETMAYHGRVDWRYPP